MSVSVASIYHFTRLLSKRAILLFQLWWRHRFISNFPDWSSDFNPILILFDLLLIFNLLLRNGQSYRLKHRSVVMTTMPAMKVLQRRRWILNRNYLYLHPNNECQLVGIFLNNKIKFEMFLIDLNGWNERKSKMLPNWKCCQMI